MGIGSGKQEPLVPTRGRGALFKNGSLHQRGHDGMQYAQGFDCSTLDVASWFGSDFVGVVSTLLERPVVLVSAMDVKWCTETFGWGCLLLNFISCAQFVDDQSRVHLWFDLLVHTFTCKQLVFAAAYNASGLLLYRAHK
jgi:hypothetical protein